MIPPSPSFFNLIRNYNPYTEETIPQLKQAFGAYGDTILNQFKRYYTAKRSSNPVENLSTFFSQIDRELASISDPGIVSGWVTFFKTQSPNVRNRTISKLGSPQFLDRNFPPPANNLITGENVYTPNVFPNIPNPNLQVPHLIHTGVDLPGYIQTNLTLANHILTEVFNSNIAPALGKLAVNTVPHMGNLVADALHPDRIMAAAPKFLQNLLQTFGSAAGFLAKNLGFNRFSVENKNVSSPNYKLDEQVAEKQIIKMASTSLPDTKDVASLRRYKPVKDV